MSSTRARVSGRGRRVSNPVAAALALVLGAGGCRGGGSERTSEATSGAAPVGLHQRFEVSFALAHPGRAADDVLIDARFTAPSGRVVRVGGFSDDSGFRVRFAPPELGRWTYDVRADAGAGLAPVAAGTLDAVPSDDPGLVRVDPVEPSRLLHDDGTPFFILGENRINVFDPTWNWQHLGIRDYVAYVASHGMTTLRVFVFSDCENEEAADRVQLGCLEPAVGRFDPRVAARFDELFEAAEAHGVYVVVSLFAIGFSDDTWKSWADNPYARERGGPADTAGDFFTDPRARAGAERRVRYFLDRFGYSSHLLAIDLLNEPEWDGRIPESIWVPWADALAAQTEKLDPYGHLVTTGPVGLHYNLGGDERSWFDSPYDDLVQWHLYGAATYEPRAHALEMTRKVDETRGSGKPVFCGEFAYGGEDPVTFDHTHTGIWALAFSGAGAVAHSAPPFNVDSDEPMTPERGRHFGVLAGFLEGLDWDRGLTPRHDAGVPPGALHVWELGAPDYRALWLLGPARGYGAPVVGARVTVRGLPAGRYAVEWWDDVSGLLVAAWRLDHGGGDAQLTVPRFVRHLAGKVLPADDGDAGLARRAAAPDDRG